MHGGTVRRGVASPNYRGGRFSREMPTRLADRFHQAETDPALLSARSDVALLHVRIGELISRLHNGESGSIWDGLRGAYAAAEEAIAAKVIDNGDIWMDALDSRNKMSHTYSYKDFEKIITSIEKSYYPELNNFYLKMLKISTKLDSNRA